MKAIEVIQRLYPLIEEGEFVNQENPDLIKLQEKAGVILTDGNVPFVLVLGLFKLAHPEEAHRLVALSLSDEDNDSDTECVACSG